jgi:hypothetical protein
MGTRRHKDVPYLWRSRCCCGQWFLAPTEDKAKAAIAQHLSEEEPFPDMGLTATEEPQP